ncbi:MAG: glycerophosphodiester phosphodiesterase [Tatlockia sp.]|nr:glycerophosphodiester phosphodiesterase [Tatlockia sp.]
MLLNFAEKILDGFFAFFPRKMPSRLHLSEVCLIAHRGAHDNKLEIIENTDAAFARALVLGCWGIEFDVHATADGILVINHDPTLARLWGKNLQISQLNFETLRQLVPQIPTLAEVVERYGKRMHLFIELKAPFVAEEALKEELKSLRPGEDYHLLSLDGSLFSTFKSFSPAVLLLVPVHNNVSKFCNLALQNNYGGVLGHYLLLNNTKVAQLNLAKKRVGVGMVDSRFGLYRELNRGLTWIFSNNVSVLGECIERLKKS